MDLISFIKYWNINYPYDRYWRKKYGISFGSEMHKKMNFIDMVIDLKEDIIMKELDEQFESDSKDREFEETSNELSSLNGFGDSKNQAREYVQMNKKEVDKEFDNLDLTQFND